MKEDYKDFLEEIKRKVYFGQLTKEEIMEAIEQAENDIESDKTEKDIPFVAFGNNELKNKPIAGKTIKCKKCGKMHKIKYGTTDGKINKMVGFTECGKSLYMVTLDGKVV
jgi:hypothetical protein